MTHLSVLMAQSVTSALLTIIGLLLVAGIIGYVSAWFYAKSVYTPVIKKLTAEKEELIEQVEGLKRQVEVMKGEIIKLNGTIQAQSEKLKALEKELEEKKNEIKKLNKPLKEI